MVLTSTVKRFSGAIGVLRKFSGTFFYSSSASVNQLAILTKSNLVPYLVRIRKDPTFSSQYDKLLEYLRENMDSLKTDPKALILAANSLSNLIKRGFLDRSLLSHDLISELLEAAIRTSSGIVGTLLARSFRAASILDPTPRAGKLISELLAEAAATERLLHYSAMDLSELTHSSHQILARWKETDASGCCFQRGLSSFVKSLSEEFVERRTNIEIRLQKTSTRETETMTIQSVSNILFALAEIQKNGFDVGKHSRRDSSVAAIHLLGHHTEIEAFRSCQVHHVITLLDAIHVANAPVTSSVSRVFRQLLLELERRFDQIDSTKELERKLIELSKYAKDSKTLSLLKSLETRLRL